MADGHLAPGTAVGRYQVLGLIGRGAMGEVYAAYHPDLDRRIALKVVHESGPKSEERRARLLREARAIARFAHPNVVAVHDAGAFGEHVYIAMEFVDGKTVYDWLLTPRSWREVLDVFLAAGRGLAAAHAADVVHRDFKPENVMVGKDSAVKVMDFGLARMVEEASGDDSPSPAASLAAPAPTSVVPTTMTKTGAVLGTPAYMSPEQFRGQRGDAKSDQFSFCVALYEALYGERPFEGDDVLTLSSSVTLGELRPPPKERPVPPWLRRAVARGMKTKPDARWPSMAALVAALEDDPALKRRRRLLAAGAMVLLAAAGLGGRHLVVTRHADAAREVGRHLQIGIQAADVARGRLAVARALRQRAFDAFDALDGEVGESRWREVRAAIPPIDSGFDDAVRALDTALSLDGSRADLRRKVAELRNEHYVFAADFRLANRIDVLAERLALADGDGSRRKALAAPGSVSVRTVPYVPGATLERYRRDLVTGARSLDPVGRIEVGPSRALAAGSYRLIFEGSGLAHVVHTFELQPGEHVTVELQLPSDRDVPDGFVYIPPGEFWFGDVDEELRTQFLETVPIHRRRSEGFLIARYETTYAEWIRFLEALPASDRRKRVPTVSGVHNNGVLRLQELTSAAGRRTWELVIQPGTRTYRAQIGQDIEYVGRQTNVRQDWTRFPVAGLTVADVEAYAAWLRTSGGVTGARLCTEFEWERAARGADDRLYPHGDRIRPEEANFDRTYDRMDSAFGPDVVGRHPETRSPFDVDDLAGNLYELVASSLKPGEITIRGGGYYFGGINCRVTSRQPVPLTFKGITTGVRLCASFPAAPLPDPIDTARTQEHRR